MSFKKCIVVVAIVAAAVVFLPGSPGQVLCPAPVLEDFSTQALLGELGQRAVRYFTSLSWFSIVVALPFVFVAMGYQVLIVVKMFNNLLKLFRRMFFLVARCWRRFVQWISDFTDSTRYEQEPPLIPSSPNGRAERNSSPTIRIDLSRNSSDASENEGYVLERAMQGSEFLETAKPDFQVSIHGIGSHCKLLGQGFRVGNILYTAGHVVNCGFETVRIKDKQICDIAVDQFVVTHTDIAYVNLSPKSWSVLGTKAGKFATKAVQSLSTVKVHGIGKSSSGIIGPAIRAPMLEYRGSTSPGFSGAPYCVNTTIVGMHIGAGSGSNLAVDANYISTISGRQDFGIISGEDTTDYLRDVFERASKSGRKFQAVSSPIDPDDITALINGKYYSLTLDDYEDYSEILDFDIKKKSYRGESAVYPTYEDSSIDIEQSKNGKAPVFAGASTSNRVAHVGRRSQAKRSETMTSHGRKTSINPSINSPEVTSVQQKTASEFTATLPKERQEMFRNLLENMSDKQWMQFRKDCVQ